MANWCYNTVHFTGAPQMLLILHDKLLFAQKEARLQAQAFLAPCIETHPYQKAFFECDIELDNDVLTLNYETKWAPNIEDIFLLAYAFDLTCEGSAEESGNGVHEEFKCSKSAEDETGYLFEFKGLDDKEYAATSTNVRYDAYIADREAELLETDEDDEDDDRCERLDDLLSSKQWEPFDLNPELLKKKVYEPSTQY